MGLRVPLVHITRVSGSPDDSGTVSISDRVGVVNAPTSGCRHHSLSCAGLRVLRSCPEELSSTREVLQVFWPLPVRELLLLRIDREASMYRYIKLDDA